MNVKKFLILLGALVAIGAAVIACGDNASPTEAVTEVADGTGPLLRRFLILPT